MKLKLEEAITINQALNIAAKSGVKGKTNYAIAKNIKKLEPILKEFDSDNKIRIDSFATKGKDGNPVIIGNNIDFGDNLEEATKVYKELLSKEVEVEIYTVLESEEAHVIPANALAILLDVVIIEEPKTKTE